MRPKFRAGIRNSPAVEGEVGQGDHCVTRCVRRAFLLGEGPEARLYREGKATLSRQVAEILDRLGSGVDRWQARLEALRRGLLLDRFFATSRERLRALADRLGLRRVPNLGGCPAG
jgi:hypothetical protein